MKRPIGTSLLIASVLGGCPLRAAGAAGTPTLRVHLRCGNGSGLLAVCASADVAPANARVVVSGRATWLELSAAARGDLARALERLRRLAAAAGAKLHVREVSAVEEIKALSCRSSPAHEPSLAAGRAEHVALLDMPPGPEALSCRPAGRERTPAARDLGGPAARPARGPPA